MGTNKLIINNITDSNVYQGDFYFNGQTYHNERKANKNDYQDAEIIEETAPLAEAQPDNDCAPQKQEDIDEDNLNLHILEFDECYREHVINQIISSFDFKSNEIGTYPFNNQSIQLSNEDLKIIFALIFGVQIDECIDTSSIDPATSRHFFRALMNHKRQKSTQHKGEEFSRLRVANILGFFKDSDILLATKLKILESVFEKSRKSNIGGLTYQMNQSLDPGANIFPGNAKEHVIKCIHAVIKAKISLK
ncbi:MAG: hypothetical protein PUI72_06835 [Prevotellaceae bacterium]|nr:hypothetical protein [Prevotellaceae bacterium]MDY6200268.1 hypothetical protein [Prevotella sp.]